MLSRWTLLWLLGALFLNVLLHSAHLPIWILLVAMLGIGWRLLMSTGRVSTPKQTIKAIMVALSITGIYQSYFSWQGAQFSLEAMVALFAIGAALKPVEVSTVRDTYVLIYLCYFFAAVAFLFEQTPLMALAVLCSILLSLAAQISLNLYTQPKRQQFVLEEYGFMQPALLAGKMLLQSLPLAIVLFILVPRVAPLWSIHVDTHGAKTGLSDVMKPGDIAHLSNSDELAFIARFHGPVPKNEHMYWRGLVLDQFDGATWSSADASLKNMSSVQRGKVRWGADDLPMNSDAWLSYSVLLEPHDRHWLFALDRVHVKPSQGESSNGNQQDLGVTTADYRLLSRRPVRNKFQYQVASDLNAALYDGQLSSSEHQRFTQLPFQARFGNGLNPKAKALVLEYLGMSELPSNSISKSRNVDGAIGINGKRNSNVNASDFVKKLQSFYKNQNFTYTLTPGVLEDKNNIDEFLFETQRGFCAHYAGSFTYLMRLAGIPARVVAGYQGGEYNADGGFVAVHQYNAHAWMEYWQKGKGWIRFDPTNLVAPDRIELGIEQALQNEFSNRSLLSTRNWPLLNEWRKKMQAMEFYWNSWVLSYDEKKQKNLIKQWLGDVSWQYYGMLLMGLVLLSMALQAGFMWLAQARSKVSPLEKEYHLLLNVLSKKGLSLNPSLPVGQVFELVKNTYPNLAAQLKSVGSLYELYLYGRQKEKLDKNSLRLFKRQNRRLRASIKKQKPL